METFQCSIVTTAVLALTSLVLQAPVRNSQSGCLRIAQNMTNGNFWAFPALRVPLLPSKSTVAPSLRKAACHLLAQVLLRALLWVVSVVPTLSSHPAFGLPGESSERCGIC